MSILPPQAMWLPPFGDPNKQSYATVSDKEKEIHYQIVPIESMPRETELKKTLRGKKWIQAQKESGAKNYRFQLIFQICIGGKGGHAEIQNNGVNILQNKYCKAQSKNKIDGNHDGEVKNFERKWS